MYSKRKGSERHVETIPNTNKYGVFFRNHFVHCNAGSVIRHELIFKREGMHTAQKAFPSNVFK